MHTLVPWYSIPAVPLLVELARTYPVQSFAAGVCLQQSLRETTQFMVVEEGICQHQLGGTMLNTVELIGPGGAFGEIPCITPFGSHGSVSALTDVRVRAVPREALLACIEQDLAQSTAFLRYVVNKSKQVWRLAALLMSLSAKERFLYLLNTCIGAQTLACPAQDYFPLHPPISQTQIADMLAINRITLARIIRPLREQGLLKTSGSRMLVHREALRALRELETAFEDLAAPAPACKATPGPSKC